MRHLLTGLGALLVALLAAAASVPRFVDWAAHRTWVDAALSRAAGHRVRTVGTLDIALFPTPRLRVGGLSLGRPGEAVELSTGPASVELSVPALVAGRIDVQSAAVTAPRLTLRRAGAPRGEAPGGAPEPLPWLAGPIDAGRIGVARLDLRQGRALIEGEGGTLLLEDVEGTLRADRLRGPLRAEGRARVLGQPLDLALSLGRVEGGRAPLSLRAALPGGPRAEVTGVARLEAGAPAFEGSLSATGRACAPLGIVCTGPAGVPWRAAARLRSAGLALLAEDLALDVGDDGPVRFEGRAELPLSVLSPGGAGEAPPAGAPPGAGPRAALLVLNAGRVNLDRLLGADAGAPAALAARLLAGEGASPAPPGAPATAGGRAPRVPDEPPANPAAPPPLRVELSAGAIDLAGGTVASPRLALRLGGAGAVIEAFEAGLPGGRVGLEGSIGEGGFAGRLSLSAEEDGRLVAWLAGAPPAATGAPFALRGALGVGPAGAALDEAWLRFGEPAPAAEPRASSPDRPAGAPARAPGEATGALRWLRGAPGGRARLEVRLRAEGVDLAQLPALPALNLSGGPGRAGDPDRAPDLRLDLAGGALSWRGAGAGAAEALIVREAGALRVERLALRDLAGASLTASGALDDAGAPFALRLEARQLDGVADLARRLAPGPWSEALARRAPALGPASLAFTVGARDAATGLREGGLRGRLGGTRVEGRLGLGPDGAPAPGGALDLALEAPSGAALLMQLLGAAPEGEVAPPGPGALRLVVDAGAPGAPGEARLDARLAGVVLRARGAAPAPEGAGRAVTPAPLGPLSGLVPRLPSEGEVEVEAADIGPLARAAGLGALLPAGPAPARFTARARAVGGGGWALDDLVGDVAGQRVRGAVAGGAGARVAGRLALDALDPSRVLALLLGPPRPAPPGAPGGWSAEPFAPVGGGPGAPAGDLWIEASALGPVLGARLEDAGFALSADPGRLAVTRGRARLAGGAGGPLTFEGALSRDGEGVALVARVGGEVALALPGLAARVAGTVDLAARGGSPAALAASLAGGGALRVLDGRVDALDPAALGRLAAEAAAAVDADGIDAGRLGARLLAALASAPSRVEGVEAPLVIAGGLARLGPLALGGGAVGLAVSLDARTGAAEARAELRAPPPPGWPGAAPRASVVLPLRPPGPRRAEAAALSNALAALLLTRELDRIEDLEARARRAPP